MNNDTGRQRMKEEIKNIHTAEQTASKVKDYAKCLSIFYRALEENEINLFTRIALTLQFSETLWHHMYAPPGSNEDVNIVFPGGNQPMWWNPMLGSPPWPPPIDPDDEKGTGGDYWLGNHDTDNTGAGPFGGFF